MKYRVVFDRKLKLSKGDEVYVFDTIKGVSEFLNIEKKKMPYISVYSKVILGLDSPGGNKSHIKGALKMLGDWKLEREEIYSDYEIEDIIFNDYEYGWYGHHGVFGAQFMQNGKYEDYIIYDGRKKPRNVYITSRDSTIEQIQTIQSVKFISGDYRKVI